MPVSMSIEHKKMNQVSKKLDEAFAYAESFSFLSLSKKRPPKMTETLTRWNFGAYGWTSPVNLMLTAAWYKWLHPKQDVCKIWASDHNKKPIPGAFAIRSNDEKFTVPLVTKTSIAPNFCSPNSGMQGSRAIEKMRSEERINRDTPINQKVSFDMQLFQSIMNDINDCTSDQAYYYFCLLLRKGIDIKSKRESELASLTSKKASTKTAISKLLNFCDTVGDPQFIKTFTACMLKPFVQKIQNTPELIGIEGSKTAADSQSKAPGDFWFKGHRGEIIGVEVKDKTKKIGFDILHAIESRKTNNPNMAHYIAVSASISAVSEENLKDPFWDQKVNQLREMAGVNVVFFSLRDLAGMYTLFGGSPESLIAELTNLLSRTIDLKPNTIKNWKDRFLTD
jgi:hypothetical protein